MPQLQVQAWRVVGALVCVLSLATAGLAGAHAGSGSGSVAGGEGASFSDGSAPAGARD